MLKFKLNLNCHETYGTRVGRKVVFSQEVGDGLDYIEQDPVALLLFDPPVDQPPHLGQPSVGKSPRSRELHHEFGVRRLKIFTC